MTEIGVAISGLASFVEVLKCSAT